MKTNDWQNKCRTRQINVGGSFATVLTYLPDKNSVKGDENGRIVFLINTNRPARSRCFRNHEWISVWGIYIFKICLNVKPVHVYFLLGGHLRMKILGFGYNQWHGLYLCLTKLKQLCVFIVLQKFGGTTIASIKQQWSGGGSFIMKKKKLVFFLFLKQDMKWFNVFPTINKPKITSH